LIGPGISSIGILFALFMLISGNWSFSALDRLLGSAEKKTAGGLILLGDRDDRPAGCIRIATFNIDQFNEAKSAIRQSEAGVDILGTIAQIVKTFDLIAIQELRGADGVALQRLVGLLNESSQSPGAETGGVTGGRYAATMSEPIGEQNPESYAFLWDKTRVNLVPGSDYVVLDTGNRIYREPMVATFQTAVPAGGAVRPFRFTMINVHTQPDRGDPRVLQNEINVLADVFQRVRIYESENFAEDDFILLGALNTNAESLRQLTTIPGVVSLAGEPDVDSPNRTDHIVIDQGVTAEYAGRTGVIDFRTALGLTEQQAQGISHHVPVWAEFSVYEQMPVPPKQATASGTRTRVIQ
jgi:endonuclease/exonuclease/phosphatase family metal-dependent hydrolase